MNSRIRITGCIPYLCGPKWKASATVFGTAKAPTLHANMCVDERAPSQIGFMLLIRYEKEILDVLTNTVTFCLSISLSRAIPRTGPVVHVIRQILAYTHST